MIKWKYFVLHYSSTQNIRNIIFYLLKKVKSFCPPVVKRIKWCLLQKLSQNLKIKYLHLRIFQLSSRSRSGLTFTIFRFTWSHNVTRYIDRRHQSNLILQKIWIPNILIFGKKVAARIYLQFTLHGWCKPDKIISNLPYQCTMVQKHWILDFVICHWVRRILLGNVIIYW